MSDRIPSPLRVRLLTLLMRLSGPDGLGRFATQLATWLTPAYKERKYLAYLTPHPYIAPGAEILCPKLVLEANVFIDDRVTIYSHADGGEVVFKRRAHIYRNSVIEVGQGGSVVIGENAHIQGGCYINAFAAGVRIGAQVQVAPQCGFSPYRHNIDDLEKPIWAQGISSKGDIVVEDDAWIGMGVRILDGVTIGRGAVIGAGAVVTHSIPPYAIAAGVPARVIGMRGEKVESR